MLRRKVAEEVLLVLPSMLFKNWLDIGFEVYLSKPILILEFFGLSNHLCEV